MIGPPLVSIVMPARDAADSIPEAIASVMNQSLSSWELLVVDDCSRDSTRAIVEAFADDRIRLLANSGKPGISDALNSGITASRGQYIARFDADDLMLPRRLEAQVSFLDRRPDVVLCGSWLELFDGAQGTWRYPEQDIAIKPLLLFQCCIGHPSVMLRREILEISGQLYDPKLITSEDYDLWTRLSGHGKFHCLPAVLTRYRCHSAQVTRQRALAAAQINRSVREEWIIRLYGEVDATMLALHERLATLTYPPEAEFVGAADRWFRLLLERNRHRPFFDTEALQATLLTKFYDVCATLTTLGLPVYRRATRSALGVHLSASRRARLLVKALLKR